MLDKAAERNLYDELACADLTSYLAACDSAYDLAVAADVFVYIGDLAPVFRAVHAALRPGGRFCFSVEAGDGADYVLRPSNRYAHTPDYLQRLAAETGFTVLASQAIEARQENGAPIAGHAMLLCK